MQTTTRIEWAVDWEGDEIEEARDRDDAHRRLRMGSIGGGEGQVVSRQVQTIASDWQADEQKPPRVERTPEGDRMVDELLRRAANDPALGDGAFVAVSQALRGESDQPPPRD